MTKVRASRLTSLRLRNTSTKSIRKLNVSFQIRLRDFLENPDEFLKELYKPVSKDAIQLLHQLQNSVIGSCEHFDETYPSVLKLDLYLTLEKRRQEKREKEEE